MISLALRRLDSLNSNGIWARGTQGGLGQFGEVRGRGRGARTDRGVVVLGVPVLARQRADQSAPELYSSESGEKGRLRTTKRASLWRDGDWPIDRRAAAAGRTSLAEDEPGPSVRATERAASTRG